MMLQRDPRFSQFVQENKGLTPEQIAKIVDDMLEELHDAKKSEYPEIAKREYEIAVQELAHAEKDHMSTVELVAKYAKENGEPPEYMQEIWNENHEHYIERHARVKCMIDTYAKA